MISRTIERNVWYLQDSKTKEVEWSNPFYALEWALRAAANYDERTDKQMDVIHGIERVTFSEVMP